MCVFEGAKRAFNSAIAKKLFVALYSGVFKKNSTKLFDITTYNVYVQKSLDFVFNMCKLCKNINTHITYNSDYKKFTFILLSILQISSNVYMKWKLYSTFLKVVQIINYKWLKMMNAIQYKDVYMWKGLFTKWSMVWLKPWMRKRWIEVLPTRS